jgi:hypothetical protein
MSAFVRGAILLVAVLACDSSAGLDPTSNGKDLAAIDVGLPRRAGQVDLAAVTPMFRTSGGNAFVKLTGEPTRRALEVLGLSGLEPPTGHSAIVVFGALRIATVWGYLPSGGVERLAALTFVEKIEPSESPGPIQPQ